MMQWTQLSGTETLIIIFICFGIWLSYTIYIINNKRSKEGVFRSGLFALALIFLCLLFFKPMIRVKKIKGTAILITEDVEEFPDSLPVFALTTVKPNEKTIQVPDLSYIERNHPEINNLYIIGNNLPPGQLKQIQNLRLKFPDQDPEGFTWLSYNRNIIEGEKLTVSGTYDNNSADSIQLRLVVTAGIIDSTFIPPNKSLSFSMQGSVEFPGNYMGNIEILKRDSLVREPLPYTITSAKPINVMILQAFPSFEMNVLKEWLAEQRHRVQVNVQISRDNYAVQYINQEETDGKNFLSQENLNNIDILIADAERIRKFGNIEKENIQKAVNKGLGVLVFADARTVRNPEVLDEKFQMINSTGHYLISGALNKKKLKLKKLPLSIKETLEVVPVLDNKNEDIPIAYIPKGRGKIALQMITETFPLVLKGENKTYNSHWSEIINRVSRRENVIELQIKEFPFIWQNEMAQLDINDTTIKKINYIDETGRVQNLFPKRGLMNPFVVSFNFLPVHSGWYKFMINSQRESFEYIMPNDAWNGLKKVYWQRKIKEVYKNDTNFKKEEFAAYEEVPLFWWYVGFICSIGMLWWLEKRK